MVLSKLRGLIAWINFSVILHSPDSKVHGANMGPTWVQIVILSSLPSMEPFVHSCIMYCMYNNSLHCGLALNSSEYYSIINIKGSWYPHSAAYMRQRMACRLLGAKLSSKPMLDYFSIGQLGTNVGDFLHQNTKRLLRLLLLMRKYARVLWDGWYVWVAT